MPHDGVIFIAEHSHRGSQKLLWSVMAITANRRRRAHLMRGRSQNQSGAGPTTRNRNRTPEPVAYLAKQEGTVQWKRTDQSNNDPVKRDLFEEMEGRP